MYTVSRQFLLLLLFLLSLLSLLLPLPVVAIAPYSLFPYSLLHPTPYNHSIPLLWRDQKAWPASTLSALSVTILPASTWKTSSPSPTTRSPPPCRSATTSPAPTTPPAPPPASTPPPPPTSSPP